MSAAELSSLAGWDIAKRFGCAFIGDCNPIDHDGTFYDVRDWEEYGYASCVVLTRLPDEGDGAALLVEHGTINRPSKTDGMAECFRCCGFRPVGDHLETDGGDQVDRIPEVEIECVLAYWGFERSEDFGGPYVQRFEEDEDGYIDEDKVWAAIEGWLSSLGN